jgi:hypothetical protein
MRVSVAASVALLCAAGGCNDAPTPSAHSGNEEGPEVRILAEAVRVVVEAEGGRIVAPFAKEEFGGASGGACVVLAEKWESHEELNPAFKTKDGGRPLSKDDLSDNPPGSALVPNGMVEIPFEIPEAGAYTLWVRAHFHCQCGDSFFFSIDADPPIDNDGNGTYDDNPPAMLGGTTHGRWKWFTFRERAFELTEGAHVMRVFPREDGVRIDQVLFAKRPGPPLEPYVPMGIETSTK